jgi:hypothetical protein
MKLEQPEQLAEQVKPGKPVKQAPREQPAPLEEPAPRAQPVPQVQLVIQAILAKRDQPHRSEIPALMVPSDPKELEAKGSRAQPEKESAVLLQTFTAQVAPTYIIQS